jgi:hypothetical protein
MVMAHVTVSITATALLQLLDGPALLSKQVRLSTYVVDAVVIHAHPQMAQWYGFSDPTQMQGLYLSQLHDRECLAQVRRYSVARLLGLPGVPDAYDMCIKLPNGGKRWLRKQRVHQISEGNDLYWVSQSVPIEPSIAQTLPDISLPISSQELRQIAGWGTVADVEDLIQKEAGRRPALRGQTPSHPLPFVSEQMRAQNPTLQRAAINHTLQSGTSTSFELPFGDPDYRRWVHHCCRCERSWVAASPKPKKCNHCKSPYWNQNRVRNRGPREVR